MGRNHLLRVLPREARGQANTVQSLYLWANWDVSKNVQAYHYFYLSTVLLLHRISPDQGLLAGHVCRQWRSTSQFSMWNSSLPFTTSEALRSHDNTLSHVSVGIFFRGKEHFIQRKTPVPLSFLATLRTVANSRRLLPLWTGVKEGKCSTAFLFYFFMNNLSYPPFAQNTYFPTQYLNH